MINFFRRRMRGIAALLAVLFVVPYAATANFAWASATTDDFSLAKGAIEDVTPGQRYQTAIREAGGAYKAALRECNLLSGGDHRVCVREAKGTYDRDMAEAKMILRDRAPVAARDRR